MKFRPYGKFGKKDKKVILSVALIFLIIFPYLFGGLYLLWHIPYEATMKYQIDDSEFIDANYQVMADMAEEFNFYYEKDNSPLDYVLTVHWEDTTFNKVERYGTAGDATIWTGMMLAAQSLNYAVNKRGGDTTKISRALKLAERALRGVSILIAVPSGGIGEEYPCILSRSVTPKNWTELGNAPIDAYNYDDPSSMDPDDIFEGAGKYSDWWWKGYPSTDQWSGIIMGLGQCASTFRDETSNETAWIRQRVKDLTVQIIENFIKSNWMNLDLSSSGNSRTTGQDYKISLEMTGIWLLSILKMGMLACPERYTELYYHYALERNYINSIEQDLRIFNLMNYYSLNINYVMLVNLISAEQDPSLRIRYENILEQIYYPIIRIGRNAWFNLGYLYMMQEDDPSTYDADKLLIVKDVEDQMMRFNLARQPGGSTRVPDRGGDKNPIQYTMYDPTDEYRKNPLINSLYGFILNMVGGEISEYAKRVDEYQASDFLWQRTTWEDHSPSPYTRQDSGLAYLLPYYIGRYINVFNEG